MEIRWTRDTSCGNGETCPKAGIGPDGHGYVVGVLVETTDEDRERYGIGPGEALVRVPPHLVPPPE